jgi:hypothetical protein
MRIVLPICALTFAAVALILAALHVYWALGGKWGIAASIPTIEGRRTINPAPLGTFAMALLLVIAAVTICGKAGLFAMGAWRAYFAVGSWCVCGVFLLRSVGNFKTFGWFKSVRGTEFAYWDTRLYSPLCLALAALAGIVAAGRG